MNNWFEWGSAGVIAVLFALAVEIAVSAVRRTTRLDPDVFQLFVAIPASKRAFWFTVFLFLMTCVPAYFAAEDAAQYGLSFYAILIIPTVSASLLFSGWLSDAFIKRHEKVYEENIQITVGTVKTVRFLPLHAEITITTGAEEYYYSIGRVRVRRPIWEGDRLKIGYQVHSWPNGVRVVKFWCLVDKGRQSKKEEIRRKEAEEALSIR